MMSCPVVGVGRLSFSVSDGWLAPNIPQIADSKIQSAGAPTYHLPFRRGDGSLQPLTILQAVQLSTSYRTFRLGNSVAAWKFR